jgi:hypothetical protein
VDFGTDLQGETSAINVAALDYKEHRRLVTSNSNAAYIPPGHLLFVRNKTLMAQRFDTERLQVIGEAFAVANEVEYLSSVARALFSVSGNGTLVYQTGSGATFSQLAWFDREGKQLSTVGPAARYANPRLSPDGKRVAVDIDDPQSSNTDIWVFDPNHQVPSRFTFDPGQDETPLWSNDGRSILWLSDRGGRNSFYLKASDGSGIERDLTASMRVNLSFASAPGDWSSDGHFLLYTDLQEGAAPVGVADERKSKALSLHAWRFCRCGRTDLAGWPLGGVFLQRVRQMAGVRGAFPKPGRQVPDLD